jgi:hypothetical protein
MTASESLDVARIHACAMRDLAETMVAKLESGKHDECLNLLVLLRQRGEHVAAAVANTLPKAVLAVRDVNKWAYQAKQKEAGL